MKHEPTTVDEHRQWQIAIGKAVRERRIELEKQQKDVLQILSMHQAALSAIERGNRSTSFSTIIKLAQALNLTTFELLVRAYRHYLEATATSVKKTDISQ